MSMIDFSPYQAQKDARKDQYGATTARNAYSRFLAQTRGNRNLADMQTAQEKQTPSFVSSFRQRGVAGPGIQSGIFTKGLQDYANQQFTDMSRAQQDLSNELQGFDLTDMQNAADYKTGIADIDAAKQREIAQTAATLKSFQPFMS
jgi:hypothetical protein